MRASKHNNRATVECCVQLYAAHRSIAKVSAETGIPVMSVSRILRRAGVQKNAPGEAHRGRPWSPARRAHTPAKPRADFDGLKGAEKLVARAIGRKKVTSAGYILVHIGRKTKQYEHILVAERALGRKLKHGEVVHHINTIRSDNRPENLLVCTIGYHLALHARMRVHPYWSQLHHA